LTVVAGPNGSGKSTVTSQLRLHDRMPVLDPDAIARIANASDPGRAAIAAGREVLWQWRQFIERRISFAIETTLAGIGPLERIRQARIVGYGVRVYYVAIDTPELNVERVRRRVLQGGHDIPVRDIRRRYYRSLANAPVVLTLADRASVLDNSFHQTMTIAEIEAGIISWRAPNVPTWAAKILAAVER
jgi:predicted ABC-type ATPase